ncbi:MAG TPA: DUF998 domain-containing protein [Acidimicrobiales bacterium]|nr:DUF998 domain-containing protein [Acidimicrobiales bacterium]
MATPTAPTAVRTAQTAAPSPRSIAPTGTRRLLACGAIAGPLFAVTALVEAMTRHGFTLMRNPVSLLELGSWGWVQQANFILTGLLLLAGAAGLRRTLRTGTGSVWAPRLMAIAAIGTGAAGVFRPDPGNGFPPGTPLHAGAVMSWHGIMHMVVSSPSFIAMVAFCIVIGRRAASQGRPRLRLASYAAGAICAVSVVTAPSPNGSLTLFIGVTLALLWIAGACIRALRATATTQNT